MCFRQRLFCSGLFLASSSSSAATDLGTLGGSYSFARDINQNGHVAGEASNAAEKTHAVLWKKNGIVDLGTLPRHEYSMANGLNDADQAVGYSRTNSKSGLTQAVLWDRGKAVPLPALRSDEYSQASEINNQEEIVGVNGSKAIVWRKRKAMALPDLGGEFSIALGINNAGQIVGNCQTKDSSVHACTWKNGKVFDLGTLGGRFSTANGINDRGQIVGSSETEDGSIHAFIYEDGLMKDLGEGMIRGLNSQGHFAGEAPNGDIIQGQLWMPDGQALTLDSLPATSYSSAFAVNDNGIAIGVSEMNEPHSPQPIFHATLWP